MCSIFGALNYKCDIAKTLDKMSQDQIHRGPDDYGTFIDQYVGLGHRRLSIIDLRSFAKQPMTNEDGKIQIVFNGEIYNFLELKEDLLAKGHIFKTNSDTESIIHLYEEYGINGISKLNGMFAFCLYDTKNRCAFLVRDRMGKKPLHYFLNDEELVFASELSSLKQHKNFPKELDWDNISDFLSLQYIPAPKTVYKNVFKLMPKEYIKINLEDKKITKHQYYNLDFSKKIDISFEDAAHELKSKITKAVQRRLISDVPLGVFLSGGVDSSIISNIVTKLNMPQKTHSFTITFDDKSYDESIYAREAANIINQKTDNSLILHQQEVSYKNFDLLPKMVKHYGEPFADGSMLPTFLLCEFAKKDITVALTGDGADELFAGYDRYLMMKYAKNFNFFPNVLRKLLFTMPAKFLPDYGERTKISRIKRAINTLGATPTKQYFQILDRATPKIKKMLLQQDLNHYSGEYIENILANSSSKDEIEKYLECDTNSYLFNDILTKVDIASMANSLELRSPFLDQEVVEFATSLPFEYKLNGKNKKHILKHAFQNEFTTGFFDRPKKGFGVPIAQYLRSVWKNNAYDLLFSSNFKNLGFFDIKELEQIWHKHQSGQFDYSYLLWNMLILAIFFEQ